MTKYTPSRNYLTAGVAAFVLALVSAWFAYQWTPSIVPTFLFLLTSSFLIYLALRPPVEIHPGFLKIGVRTIRWADIRTVDRTGWISPLVVFLTLSGNKRVMVVYPGDLENSKALLRNLRRCALEATIDGIPYREFWGEPSAEPLDSVRPSIRRAQQQQQAMKSPRYPILRPEDEAEVERLYQRLKTVGRLDQRSDEN